MGKCNKLVICIVGILLIFSICAFGENINDNVNKYYAKKTPDQNNKTYVHITVTSSSVMLNWEDFNKIETDDKYIAKSGESKEKELGYLVHVLKKADSNSMSYIQNIPDFSEKIYFTENKCLYLPNLEAATQYYVVVRNVVVEKTRKQKDSNFMDHYSLGYTTVSGDGTVSLQSSVEFSTPEDYKEDNKENKCETNLTKVELENLYNDTSENNNRIVEVEGYLKKITNIDYSKIVKINEMSTARDSGISDGKYVLYIGSLLPYIQKYEAENENNDYIKLLIFIHKNKGVINGTKKEMLLCEIINVQEIREKK
ncbi:MAG: hypothetical protein CVV21_05155 [Candidatus Goldiibacteriota bacterium HGW-Goldbacteria-1]|jgi:hypothetical protein|nr:MAG: hypothetical protein CVV21_05155 [Candidatus Goldiibacteriota bacterium HGW-Goldbacteria-1]